MADSIQNDPQAQANLQNEKAINAVLKSNNTLRQNEVGSITRKVDFLKRIGAYEQASAALAKDIASQQLKAQAQTQKFIDAHINAKTKINSLSEKDIANIKQATKMENDRLERVTKYSYKLDEVAEKHKKAIDDLKSQGQYIRANTRDWAAKQFGWHEENGKATENYGAATARVYTGAMSAAQNPGDALVGMLGPWGELIKVIIGAVDQSRQLGAALSSASGATGEFAKGVTNYVKIANSMTMIPYQFGMTAEEITKDAGTLAQAGISVSKTLGKSGAMSQSFIDLETFASATGQDLGTVGKQFATLINTFRLSSTEATKTYKHMYDTAQSFTKTFDVTMGDMINSIMSVAESVQDLGITVDSITDLFNTLDIARKGTTLGLQDITMAASQLANIGKTASLGWQAFMGVMGGHASGGFLGGLGAFQQRGAGFLLPKMNSKQLDPGKQLEMMQATLDKATAGVYGTANKQFMQEQIAGQMGISPEVTEILEKMKTGELSKAGGKDAMKVLIQTMADNKITNVGLLQRLEQYLTTYIADPIKAIYSLILNMNPFSSHTDNRFRDATRGFKKADMGASVVTGGLMFVHGGEDIVPNAASIKPRMSSSSYSNPGQPINMQFNVSMNEKDIKKAFMDAEDKMLRIVRNTKQRLAM